GRANGSSGGAKNGGSQESERSHRTHSRDQRHQERSSRQADSTTQQGSNGIAHARLLGCVGGNGLTLFVDLVGTFRRDQGVLVNGNACFVNFLKGFLGGCPSWEYSGNCFHSRSLYP